MVTLAERDAVASYIANELRRRVPPDKATPDAMKDALVEICSEMLPTPEITVEIDPDQPGAIRITAPIDMVEQLRKV